MTVLSIGIFALVAGFSSGFGAINRASKTSTAGALADQQMEAFRRGAYDCDRRRSPAPTTTGPDGRTYWIEATSSSRGVPGRTTPSARRTVLHR